MNDYYELSDKLRFLRLNQLYPTHILYTYFVFIYVSL